MAKPELPPTKNGYVIWEVVSAYQKAIRRSDVDGALYWGLEGYRSGHGNWMWKRLRTIVTEDIGPAAPGLPSDVYALQEWYRDGVKKGKGEIKGTEGMMEFAHATILAAKAPKNRIVQWAMFAVEGDGREIPDEALDRHTRRGLHLGRGKEHFFEESAKLIQPNGETLHQLESKYREVRRKQLGLDKDEELPEEAPALLPEPEEQ